MSKKVALIILDGWGYGKKDRSDAIFQAHTPVFDELIEEYPNAQLLTDGENVGLPEGQMGNSEVGHLNIGAGRVVYQDLVKINKAIENKELSKNKTLLEAFNYAKTKGVAVHFLGLVSDGGIHSHQNHLYALCEIAEKEGLTKTFIHAFSDGRDTDPHGAKKFISQLENKIKGSHCKIASLCGRYYAMDRDLRWERIKVAYDALKSAKGKPSQNIQEAIQQAYDAGITDEFIEPIICVDANNIPLAKIEKDDVVICFNYRTDRCREITRALSQEDFPQYDMQKENYRFLTMTNYDNTFKNIEVLFRKDNLSMTLGEVISKAGKSQLRIAETEKYPHVSFFFSGGREAPFEGEKRIMVNSPKVATYDLQPEMSAEELSKRVIEEMETVAEDFICLNFANPDMVGHTGVYAAIKTAVETVDKLLGKIIEIGRNKDYSFVVIADHGNADFVINEDGTPNTAHSTNPVPIIVIDKECNKVKNGKLADIAPSILKLMHLDIPKEMTGDILV